jgi:hypothetical protein
MIFVLSFAHRMLVYFVYHKLRHAGRKFPTSMFVR